MYTLVSFPDPTSCKVKGLANLGQILSSRSVVRANKAKQSLDLIGQYGCVDNSNLHEQNLDLIGQHDCVGNSSVVPQAMAMLCSCSKLVI